MRAWQLSAVFLACLSTALVQVWPRTAEAAPFTAFDFRKAGPDPGDKTIPDDDTADFVFEVADDGPVADPEIVFSAVHPFVPDLSASLISPAGTEVVLFFRIGVLGPPFENYQDTRFRDGELRIDDALAPFAGTFGLNAAAVLSDFGGEDAQGLWTLRVTDHEGGDSGSLAAPGDSAPWGLAQGTRLFLAIIPEPATTLIMLAGLGACLRRRAGPGPRP